jgi:hypothetical protein
LHCITYWRNLDNEEIRKVEDVKYISLSQFNSIGLIFNSLPLAYSSEQTVQTKEFFMVMDSRKLRKVNSGCICRTQVCFQAFVELIKAVDMDLKRLFLGGG